MFPWWRPQVVQWRYKTRSGVHLLRDPSCALCACKGCEKTATTRRRINIIELSYTYIYSCCTNILWFNVKSNAVLKSRQYIIDSFSIVFECELKWSTCFIPNKAMVEALLITPPFIAHASNQILTYPAIFAAAKSSRILFLLSRMRSISALFGAFCLAAMSSGVSPSYTDINQALLRKLFRENIQKSRRHG